MALSGRYPCFKLVEISSKVGTVYNVRENLENREHEVLEERRENGIPFTRERVGPRSIAFVF